MIQCLCVTLTILKKIKSNKFEYNKKQWSYDEIFGKYLSNLETQKGRDKRNILIFRENTGNESNQKWTYMR